jgi:hypothetical protein
VGLKNEFSEKLSRKNCNFTEILLDRIAIFYFLIGKFTNEYGSKLVVGALFVHQGLEA